MSLEELLNVPVAVASRKGMTTRESPGIVTLITRDEIERSGARNLLDILRLVPGLEFGVDVQGSLGIGSRGNWGQEGKVVLLMDGLEMNEKMYGTFNYANPLAVDHIERIEIVRGPGSAIYGGSAELGVINIISRQGGDIQGVEAGAVFGVYPSGVSRALGTFAAGKGGEAGAWSVTGSAGRSDMSDKRYTDIFGDSYSMKEQSRSDPTHINAAFEWGALSTRYIWDRHHTTERDEFDAILDAAVDVDFTSHLLETKYEFFRGTAFTLTPRVVYSHQTPWKEVDPAGSFYNKQVESLLGEAVVSYDPSAAVNVLAGAGNETDRARVSEDTLPDEYFSNGESHVSYTRRYGFGQVQVNSAVVNLTAGARYEDHSQAGHSFVPRAALTKVFGKNHVKLLYSQAFRAPSIENLNLNPSIKPEETTVYEAELGRQLTPKMFLTANVFQIKINRPIVYYYDAGTDTEGYLNYNRTGSRGAELEFRLKDRWGFVTGGYSYYGAYKNEVDSTRVADDDRSLVGMPTHKVVLSASLNLSPSLSFSPSVLYRNNRFGYDTVDPADGSTPVIRRFDSNWIANAYLRKEGFLTNRLTVGIGVANLFGGRDPFIQPYNSGHAPLPGSAREIYAKATYRFARFNDAQ